jgi:hypothetical protein
MQKKIIDIVQYGKTILEDNSERALALVPRNILDVTKKNFSNREIFTQWFKHPSKIFLSIYWPKEKKGLIFPFLKEQENVIKLIISKKSLAIGNTIKNKRLLVLTISKNEPLGWMENW